MLIPQKKLMAPNEDCLVTFGTPSIAVNYESFLTQSRSGLDSFFSFIYNKYGKPSSSLSKKYPNYIDRFCAYCEKKKDNPLFLKLLEQTNEILEEIKPTLVKLRNKIMHENSTLGLIGNQFAVFTFANGKALFIDCDVDGIPLLESMNRLSMLIPFYLTKSLGIIVDYEGNFDLSDFSLKWQNNFVNHNDYVSQDGQKLQVIKFTEVGFTLNEVTVDMEGIMKKTVTL